MKLKKGILLVLEGIDGSGKSTQARRLKKKLQALGLEVELFREPSRGKWGREIKKKARLPDSLTPEEELELFQKDREENVRKNIRPSLEARRVVILDRYYFSTIAYQGAKGIDRQRIKRMNEKFAPQPDAVFILDVDAEKGLGRIRHRKKKDPLFEREAYLDRVGEIFRSYKGNKFVHVDARQSKEEIAALIEKKVKKILKKFTA